MSDRIILIFRLYQSLRAIRAASPSVTRLHGTAEATYTHADVKAIYNSA